MSITTIRAQRLSRSAATKRGGSHAKLPELVRKSDYSPAR